MGTFPEMAELLYPFESFTDWRVPHVHNLLLQVGIDVGIPGLAAWLSILINICWFSWKLYRKGKKENRSWLAGLGAALLCSQLVMLVHGIVDDVTWGVRPEPIIWGVWGIAISAAVLYLSPELKSTAKVGLPQAG
jgi:putative inorganic carbon (HCO3(-)) transporter